MAQYLHLTDERLAGRISRTGIKPGEVWDSGTKFVYATPVLDNFMLSHQWLRELKRRGIRTIVAVQFRIPDDEPVRVGRYGKEHLDTTAVGAIRIFGAHDSPYGLQVLIPRRIAPAEIMRIYVPTQLVGWRYYPEAKGKKPCGCPACQRGDIKNRKIRERFEGENEPVRPGAVKKRGDATRVGDGSSASKTARRSPAPQRPA